VSLTAPSRPSRPSLYLESAPEYLPRVTLQDVKEKGAVVIWPASDTAGQPPPDIKRQFPDLVPEAVPHDFKPRFQGRMPLIRMGWGVIRPHVPGSTPEPQVQTEPPLPLPLPPPQPEPAMAAPEPQQPLPLPPAQQQQQPVPREPQPPQPPPAQPPQQQQLPQLHQIQ
jgi:hypothetical protein